VSQHQDQPARSAAGTPTCPRYRPGLSGGRPTTARPAPRSNASSPTSHGEDARQPVAGDNASMRTGACSPVRSTWPDSPPCASATITTDGRSPPDDRPALPRPTAHHSAATTDTHRTPDQRRLERLPTHRAQQRFRGITHDHPRPAAPVEDHSPRPVLHRNPIASETRPIPPEAHVGSAVLGMVRVDRVGRLGEVTHGSQGHRGSVRRRGVATMA
jgi:hypothetical protein